MLWCSGITALYAVEEAVRSQPSSDAVRQDQAQARFDELERWLRTQLSRLSAKTPLAAAICYALTRLKRLRSEHARELRRLALRAACLSCRDVRESPEGEGPARTRGVPLGPRAPP